MNLIPHPPNKPLSTRTIVLACLAVGLLCGCRQENNQPPTATAPTPPVEVKTTRLSQSSITRYLTLPADVRPLQEATLYAKVAGYLKTISVDKGDRVNQGQVLAELEVPELKADLAKNKAELELASLDFRRLSESQKKAPDLVVAQTVDDARSKVDVAKANLERTETLLNYANIVAPFTGIVTRRIVDPGAFIPAATSGSTAQSAALLTISDFSRVRVQVAVPEAETSLVAIGQPSIISAEALPGKIFEGQVTRFSYALDEATKTMLAEIELPNEKLELRPGMYALARIGLQTKKEATVLPVDCLLTERSGSSVFFIVDGKAKKQKVQTSFNDGKNVEIVQGVEPAQEVIVLGKRVLTDGQPVVLEKAK